MTPRSIQDINASAGRDQMTSEPQAEVFVGMMEAFYGIHDSPVAAEAKKQIAWAEISARQDPSRLVPEEAAVKAFNFLASSIAAPYSSQITTSQFHYWRYYMNRLVPLLILKNGQGDVAENCRPVEAAFLLIALVYNGGISPGIRARADTGLPAPSAADTQAPITVAHLAPSAGQSQGQRFVRLLSNFLMQHPDSSRALFRKLLQMINIGGSSP